MKPLNIALIVLLSLLLMSSTCGDGTECPPQNTEVLEVNNALMEANRHFTEVPAENHTMTQVMSINLDELEKAVNACRQAGKSRMVLLPAAFTPAVADMYTQSHADVTQADILDHTFVLFAVEKDGGGYNVLNTLTSICPPPRLCGVIDDDSTYIDNGNQLEEFTPPPGAPDADKLRQ